MKIVFYEYRTEDIPFLKELGKKYAAELIPTKAPPVPETAKLAEGCEAISMGASPMPERYQRCLKEAGVRFISTRSIGYDHIDIVAAQALGIHVGNVSYSPDSVADYTVMLMLAAVRRLKSIFIRSAAQDFSLRGLQGKEMHNLTIGVIGTGRIGRAVLRDLTGFGCRLIAYTPHPSSEVKRIAEYVPLDELYAKSDLITLHMRATDETYHMIDRTSLSRMKDGVILVNTARGSLIDTGDLLDAVEAGKIGGAALDVIEHEEGLYYHNLKDRILHNRELAALRSYPNVLVTPHMAFFTDQAMRDMIETSVKSCVLSAKGEENPWQVI